MHPFNVPAGFFEVLDAVTIIVFVYFIAQLLCSLLEREIKKEMDKNKLKTIKILPEERPSTNPTAEQVFRVFNSNARHALLPKKGGAPVQIFADPLSKIQKKILKFLSVPASSYI